MYRKGAMGMSVTRLNTVAAKPFLQAKHKRQSALLGAHAYRDDAM
jgi:hypothetical protein